MPIYEYSCKECEDSFTEILSVNDRENPTKEPCKKCGAKDSLYIVLGAVGWMDIMRTTVGTARHKPTDEFREITKRIKKSNRRSNMKDY